MASRDLSVLGRCCNPKAIFSKTLRCGKRAKSWKTIPTFLWLLG
jgi:hypothetical protein